MAQASDRDLSVSVSVGSAASGNMDTDDRLGLLHADVVDHVLCFECNTACCNTLKTTDKVKRIQIHFEETFIPKLKHHFKRFRARVFLFFFLDLRDIFLQ